MLSYRHSFHAGNFADILKHSVLVAVLEHFIKKDKPFDYIDSHSGAGLFDLSSEHAQKLGEYKEGIAKLQPEQWPELSAYLNAIAAFNDQGELRYYPGSPLLAMQYLRAKDNAWLYELHPNDVELLRNNIASCRYSKRAKVTCADGLKGLLAHLPPVSRRGLVLIDPSYEIKTEYEQVVAAIAQGYKKFATGIYALWYPVVDRQTINQLEQSLLATGIKDIQRFELGLAPDSAGRGMTSSGMIVINPPWGLFEHMQQVLPRLAATLKTNAEAVYRCEVLVGE
ncbi:23S rRNA (adenine(2030)-N(6))-methyltransferase RlmJ [Dasania sp. GY-MA-18]|uniref:Ribosomal RNA large subunit methyltransferase J n=1 Tax=Dasania phycosphaerae TaxID=2950436 RepID=A0A9J6RIH8_9GAMM|nr:MULTISPECIES: 23S rRNA (adenine(2030)-N(6))-methyltransferase RlmJ [Dasania]MCR8922058.1 23S rRNA (adenine(2030)-N(6))-methyltransferase RlmJ [Dasania sp. GY-MA-18]MCZ0864486.1 23S rRNA (adenine(2030)-N(6))-methyltransferase RlmJ [Dasania phycosphaerae]MCZ0868214.1 23S rRNA (adenine(2030)-N(6))-methyltransferase RlmJ [Dasania phycosphaerae]